MVAVSCGDAPAQAGSRSASVALGKGRFMHVISERSWRK